MGCLVPPLRLVAVEYRKPLEGGKTKPRLVVAIDARNQTKQVVLKPRFPTTSVGDGHFASTSLACELICAALARAIGLKVPDYAIVEIRPDFANSIHDNATRELFFKNIGPNFGSVYYKSVPSWKPISRKLSQAVIDQLEDILSFDSIVINGDRKISNTNLLYHDDQLLLIDHSLALPVHSWGQQAFAELPPVPEEIVEGHCAIRDLKGQGCSYRRVFDSWQERINTQELEELRAMLPDSWERNAGDIDKIFTFLDNRNQCFADMSDTLMGVLS
jgi:hypothetical protein